MKKQDRYFYPAIFTIEQGKKIDIYLPDFDCATSGEDDIDALKSARELLGISILGKERDAEDVPQPTPLADIKLGENESVNLVDVFMPTVRNMANNRAVNRTVTLPAWLNAKALEHNVNFSQVLQEALKDMLGEAEE